ncbi:putative histone-like DNA-binding protein [Parabacteroides sp. PF5-5]|uniref:HU family DNA-binding protein n=1 Tax=unclassified Parabacteroides TaxID=2649774 RepID=UPI002475184B|nr:MULTISPECIES: HU family DNA-binding protein [unclassified Parabacteroides]MDH6306472.1 putative histone-like DNA-binding protein [Parabacteroides sp. PH5-39]MDH6317376.1 putative histone-like DNA-binding protein [Parabacteroides sp. PF5-13]MDH6321183.1 putative histone-like DNA-binding protein [Parabacteroides sp. PH5-13]MDH6324915.1 putative histone-like DNA-binding protein [Parabacteroides sp. PH5-8]MDH6328561.1 putative histone-like DNA-binding protein [Parabacteroides sp. PH5-41]
MALKYKLVLRKNMSPKAPNGQKLFYAQTRATRVCNFEEICDEVADTSTLSSGDLKLGVDRITSQLVKSLKKGEVVHMGELGNFQLLVRSTGSEKEGEFTQANLRRARLIFRPGAKLRYLMETVASERYIPETKEVECTRTHLD